MKKFFVGLLFVLMFVLSTNAAASVTFWGNWTGCAVPTCSWSELSPKQWDSVQQASANTSTMNFAVLNDLGRATAGRFNVREGDVVAFGERTEVLRTAAAGHSSAEGDVDDLSFETYFPSGYWTTSKPEWAIFTQWHDIGAVCSPPVDLRVRDDGHFYVLVQQTDDHDPCSSDSIDLDLGAMTMDTWIKWRLVVTWSSNPTIGHVTVYKNDVELESFYAQTLPSDAFQEVYLKQGLYRSDETFTSRVWIDGTKNIHN